MSGPPAIIVLAAGESARMGTPKQLLVHEGRTLIRRAVETALEAQAGPVIVVLGAHAGEIAQEITGLLVQMVLNPAWSEGMASSILAGLEAVPEEAPAALLMVCDQPLLTAAVLNQLIALHAARNTPVVASRYGGSLGVPALFDRSLFPELLSLRGAAGAKRVIEAHQPEAGIVPFEDGLVDLDTPEQFAGLAGR